MNERSLANLRLPKLPKEGHGYRYSLPQPKIDELFSYLAEDISLKKAAKKANICFETAKKYFERGDEKRGIKPLKYRLTVFQDKISEKFNVLLEERRIKMLETVREAIDNVEERVKNKPCKCCNCTGTQVGDDGIKQLCPACKGEGKIIGALINGSNIKDLERLMRLEVFLLGGVMHKEKETKFMTAEEIASGDPS